MLSLLHGTTNLGLDLFRARIKKLTRLNNVKAFQVAWAAFFLVCVFGEIIMLDLLWHLNTGL